MFRNKFFENEVKIDLDGLIDIIETKFTSLLKLPEVFIRRTISFGEFVKINNPTYHNVVDMQYNVKQVKQQIIAEDVRYLVSAGYKEIYLTDVFSGDTQISYVLRGVAD